MNSNTAQFPFIALAQLFPLSTFFIQAKKKQKPPSPKVNAPPLSHIPLREMVILMRPKEALSLVIETEYCR